MKDIQQLKEAVETIHGCSCSYKGSKAVTERFAGVIAWEGEVEVFDLTGHPAAKRCYAWFYEDKKGENQYTTVLEIPPVDSPETAVKIALASAS